MYNKTYLTLPTLDFIIEQIASTQLQLSAAMNVASTLGLRKPCHSLAPGPGQECPFSTVDADIGALTWTENRRSWQHLGHHRHPSISVWNGFLALRGSFNYDLWCILHQFPVPGSEQEFLRDI